MDGMGLLAGGAGVVGGGQVGDHQVAEALQLCWFGGGVDGPAGDVAASVGGIVIDLLQLGEGISDGGSGGRVVIQYAGPALLYGESGDGFGEGLVAGAGGAVEQAERVGGLCTAFGSILSVAVVGGGGGSARSDAEDLEFEFSAAGDDGTGFGGLDLGEAGAGFEPGGGHGALFAEVAEFGVRSDGRAGFIECGADAHALLRFGGRFEASESCCGHCGSPPVARKCWRLSVYPGGSRVSGRACRCL